MTPNLDLLEKEVDAARQRLVEDVERLRSPATVQGFKDELLSEARELKNEWARRAGRLASDTAQSLVADLKDRASANPAAVLAIGAGIAWRLVRHPPISSLLVSLGIVGLFRTSPDSEPSPVVTGALSLGERVNEYAATAKDKLSADGSEDARDAVLRASRAATEFTGKTAAMAKRTIADVETRDAYLLGAAVLAVGAAGVIASVRNREDDGSERRPHFGL